MKSKISKKNPFQKWIDFGVYDSLQEAFEDTGSVHQYLSGGLYLHPCGKMDEEEMCSCKKCEAALEEVGEV